MLLSIFIHFHHGQHYYCYDDFNGHDCHDGHQGLHGHHDQLSLQMISSLTRVTSVKSANHCIFRLSYFQTPQLHSQQFGQGPKKELRERSKRYVPGEISSQLLRNCASGCLKRFYFPRAGQGTKKNRAEKKKKNTGRSTCNNGGNHLASLLRSLHPSPP